MLLTIRNEEVRLRAAEELKTYVRRTLELVTGAVLMAD